MMRLIKWLLQPDRIIEGKVYYDPKVNRFFQLRKILRYNYQCSGYCEYFNDSMTTIRRMDISGAILKRSILVLAVDKLQQAEMCPYVRSWRVSSCDK